MAIIPQSVWQPVAFGFIGIDRACRVKAVGKLSNMVLPG